MTSEQITVLFGVIGVWFQVAVLVYWIGRKTQIIESHEEQLEDHEERIRAVERSERLCPVVLREQELATHTHGI